MTQRVIGSRGLLLASLACAACIGSHGAAAQTLGVYAENDTVLTRSRPGYDAIGLNLGGFRAYPRLSADIGYTDNLYAATAPKVSDVYASIRPRLSLESQWSRHRLQLVLDADVRRYADRTSENSVQFGAAAIGQVDVDSTARFDGRMSVARRIEPRGSTGDLFIGGEPIRYDQFSGMASGTKDFGRMIVRVTGNFEEFHYDNQTLNGTVLDLSARNYRTVAGTARVGYSFGPGLAAFVSGSVNRSSYLDQANLLNRDSSGYNVLGGIAFGFSRLLQGEVAVGYLDQSFENSTFPDIRGFAYSASLNWNPTRLLSLSGRASRTIQRSPIVGIAGVTQDDVSFNVDYELLRNLIVGARAGYTVSDFRGGPRVDHVLTGELSARYMMNRNFAFTLSPGHVRSRPSGARSNGRFFDMNRVVAGTTLQF